MFSFSPITLVIALGDAILRATPKFSVFTLAWHQHTAHALRADGKSISAFTYHIRAGVRHNNGSTTTATRQFAIALRVVRACVEVTIGGRFFSDGLPHAHRTNQHPCINAIFNIHKRLVFFVRLSARINFLDEVGRFTGGCQQKNTAPCASDGDIKQPSLFGKGKVVLHQHHLQNRIA